MRTYTAVITWNTCIGGVYRLRTKTIRDIQAKDILQARTLAMLQAPSGAINVSVSTTWYDQKEKT